ncbi:Scramblase-domain-containing protein [Cantharellus anzutake]|uniref:Scramblase-domain-containing protein n=1 Tax=Cantharellus anzutake TaxID=1750568 RepID=UPI001902CFAD|nr:Scramblase-domain-containing protein [Cantharellus anzutake]KAF8329793.1 Scramblase-domain-containing protein [Cantharellus anzutake]
MLLRFTRQAQRYLSSDFLGCSPTTSARLPKSFSHLRAYAWSRQPSWRDRSTRRPASARNGREEIKPIPVESVSDVGYNEAVKEIPLAGSEDAEVGLQRLLQNDTLVVVRQLEMLNVFIGFEQANRYAILDPAGNHVGYMAEEERGFLGTFSRQILRTHRPFRAVIMDSSGSPVLWIHRPFSWINSRIYAQRKTAGPNALSKDGDLMVLGEAQQEWHAWRRRYNLFTGHDNNFVQFARINAPFLSWEFYLQDADGWNIASISRRFAGWGREIFTDTGQYFVTFRPNPEAPSSVVGLDEARVYRRLTLEERATILALSVGIDFDFFSRHSERGGFGFPLFFWSFGSDE